MGFWKRLKKLKFWRKHKRCDYEISTVCLDVIIKLQTKLFESNLHHERVEYTLRERIADLEGQLKARDHERETVETTLRNQIKGHKEKESILWAKIEKLSFTPSPRKKILVEKLLKSETTKTTQHEQGFTSGNME